MPKWRKVFSRRNSCQLNAVSPIIWNIAQIYDRKKISRSRKNDNSFRNVYKRELYTL